MHSSPSPRFAGNAARLRCSNDNGTALVETAFVLLPLLFVLFGIFEGGLLFRDYLAMTNVTVAGTRTVAIYGSDWKADFVALTEMKSASAAVPSGYIDRIVVFNAGIDGRTTLTSGCQGGTPSDGVCNVYTLADLSTPEAEWNCAAGSSYTTTSKSRYWCPAANSRSSGRHTAQTGVNKAEYVGIFIQITHKFVTGLFAKTKVMSDIGIARIEPKTLG